MKTGTPLTRAWAMFILIFLRFVFVFELGLTRTGRTDGQTDGQDE